MGNEEGGVPRRGECDALGGEGVFGKWTKLGWMDSARTRVLWLLPKLHSAGCACVAGVVRLGVCTVNERNEHNHTC